MRSSEVKEELLQPEKLESVEAKLGPLEDEQCLHSTAVIS